MTRQERIDRRDEIRQMFEGKMYEGEFVYETELSSDMMTVWVYDEFAEEIKSFPYSDRHEHAKKCSKPFPEYFTLKDEDWDKKTIEQGGMNAYLAYFRDHSCDPEYVTLEEMEAEFKRRVALL